MRIAIGAEPNTLGLKDSLKSLLAERGIQTDDYGAGDAREGGGGEFARTIARQVSVGEVDHGIFVATTGDGLTQYANQFPNVRAALCLTPHMARIARSNNNGNLLVIGGQFISAAESAAVLDEWLKTTYEARAPISAGGAAASPGAPAPVADALMAVDPDIAAAIAGERDRQRRMINLIASENYSSAAVRIAQGSVMSNKYAEGYPGRRWYNGCEMVDRAEQLAIDRARQLFGVDHVNVQPHSGSGANMTVYYAMLEPGDTILAMSLDHGGHLTHGHPSNFSGRFFKIVPYGVNRDTQVLEYDEIRKLARQHKPRLIIVGASGYSRIFDFPRLRAIADEVGAYLMADIAHIAGLVAGNMHPSPVPVCDFVTTTTHKTLRGPRGGMTMCRESFAKVIDRQIFPGIQGGPSMHTIAAKAVAFHEALQPAFQDYARQIVLNAKVMAGALAEAGLRIVSGGTDNHMMLVDLSPIKVTGADAAVALEAAGIAVNKNAIPFDPLPPSKASGIRLGTPAVTTRGMREAEIRYISSKIVEALTHLDDATRLASIRTDMSDFTLKFPVP